MFKTSNAKRENLELKFFKLKTIKLILFLLNNIKRPSRMKACFKMHLIDNNDQLNRVKRNIR